MEAMANWYEEKDGDIVIRVRVVPRAATDAIMGVIGGEALKVRIQAPPVEGKANTYLVKFLARQWKIPRNHIGIIAGGTGRTKRLRISSPPPDLMKELLSIGPV